MSQATQELYSSRSRSRSRSSERKRPRVYKPSYLRSSLTRSMRPSGVYTLTKCASLKMRSNTAGYSFDIGVGSSQTFCIWFTNQDAYIWANSGLYSIVIIPGYADLAGLFDEIMIERVEMQIYTGTDPTTSAGGSAQIILAKDYNDKNATATVGDVQQYFDVKAFNMSNNFVNKYSIQPKFLTYSLDVAGAPVATTPKRGYVRSNLTIDHYGIKGGFINNSPNDQIHTYQFRFVYNCKIPK